MTQDVWGNADMLAHFSWGWFAFTAAVYTAIVFSSSTFRNDAMVFSKRNAVPASTVFIEHLKFLTTLLVLMWIASAVYSRLPAWITDMWIRSRGSYYSDLDVVLLFSMIGLSLYEHGRIYVEADTEMEAQG
jgi:hypothetical protein